MIHIQTVEIITSLIGSSYIVTQTDDSVCFVPMDDPRNADYQTIQAWITEGNTPTAWVANDMAHAGS